MIVCDTLDSGIKVERIDAEEEVSHLISLLLSDAVTWDLPSLMPEEEIVALDVSDHLKSIARSSTCK